MKYVVWAVALFFAVTWTVGVASNPYFRLKSTIMTLIYWWSLLLLCLTSAFSVYHLLWLMSLSVLVPTLLMMASLPRAPRLISRPNNVTSLSLETFLILGPAVWLIAASAGSRKWVVSVAVVLSVVALNQRLTRSFEIAKKRAVNSGKGDGASSSEVTLPSGSLPRRKAPATTMSAPTTEIPPQRESVVTESAKASIHKTDWEPPQAGWIFALDPKTGKPVKISAQGERAMVSNSGGGLDVPSPLAVGELSPMRKRVLVAWRKRRDRIAKLKSQVDDPRPS